MERLRARADEERPIVGRVAAGAPPDDLDRVDGNVGRDAARLRQRRQPRADRERGRVVRTFAAAGRQDRERQTHARHDPSLPRS